MKPLIAPRSTRTGILARSLRTWEVSRQPSGASCPSSTDIYAPTRYASPEEVRTWFETSSPIITARPAEFPEPVLLLSCRKKRQQCLENKPEFEAGSTYKGIPHSDQESAHSNALLCRPGHFTSDRRRLRALRVAHSLVSISAERGGGMRTKKSKPRLHDDGKQVILCTRIVASLSYRPPAILSRPPTKRSPLRRAGRSRPRPAVRRSNGGTGRSRVDGIVRTVTVARVE